MLTSILFGIIYGLSVLLSAIYGYYVGVRVTSDYFTTAIKKATSSPAMDKAVKKFDNESRGDFDGKSFN